MSRHNLYNSVGISDFLEEKRRIKESEENIEQKLALILPYVQIAVDGALEQAREYYKGESDYNQRLIFHNAKDGEIKGVELESCSENELGLKVYIKPPDFTSQIRYDVSGICIPKVLNNSVNIGEIEKYTEPVDSDGYTVYPENMK